MLYMKGVFSCRKLEAHLEQLFGEKIFLLLQGNAKSFRHF